jgi:hypothetical protein
MKTLVRSPKRLKPKKRAVDRDLAQITANSFILEHLPDRYCAGVPNLVEFPIRTVWSVPIMLGYPRLGVIGQVGTVIIDRETGTVAGWTPFHDVRNATRKIYKQRKAEIETPPIIVSKRS